MLSWPPPPQQRTEVRGRQHGLQPELGEPVGLLQQQRAHCQGGSGHGVEMRECWGWTINNKQCCEHGLNSKHKLYLQGEAHGHSCTRAGAAHGAGHHSKLGVHNKTSYSFCSFPKHSVKNLTTLCFEYYLSWILFQHLTFYNYACI